MIGSGLSASFKDSSSTSIKISPPSLTVTGLSSTFSSKYPDLPKSLLGFLQESARWICVIDPEVIGGCLSRGEGLLIEFISRNVL